MKAPRLFFYVQHLLGVGHQVRAQTIARHCGRAGFAVDLVDGGAADRIERMPEGVLRHALPSARSADAGFSGLVNSDGQPIDDAWKETRRRMVLDLFAETEPDILLIEGFPFARRAFRFELVPLLEAAKAAGIPVAVSVRDIIQPKKPDRVPEVLDWLDRYVDLVLVHGDPAMVPFSVSFPAVSQITSTVVHTGYVSADDNRAVGQNRNGIVVSGGGGAAAAALFEAAIEAARIVAGAYGPWRFLLGPNHPQDHAATLRRLASEDIIIEPARDDFRSVLRASRVSISQAGYNTATDLLATMTPAVLVPFEQAGQQEQRLRANRLSAMGRAVVVDEDGLTGETVSDAVHQAAEMRLNTVRPVAMDGAEKTAQALLGLVRGTNDAN